MVDTGRMVMVLKGWQSPAGDRWPTEYSRTPTGHPRGAQGGGRRIASAALSRQQPSVAPRGGRNFPLVRTETTTTTTTTTTHSLRRVTTVFSSPSIVRSQSPSPAVREIRTGAAQCLAG